MFIALSKNYRGFTYRVEFSSKVEYKAAIDLDINDNKEICWSYLFNEDGAIIYSYRRGYTLENL